MKRTKHATVELDRRQAQLLGDLRVFDTGLLRYQYSMPEFESDIEYAVRKVRTASSSVIPFTSSVI